MHIKNSVLVMTRIAPFFPLHYSAGQQLLEAVDHLISEEKRDDLKILAQG